MDTYKQLVQVYDTLQPKEEIFKQRKFFKQLIKNYAVKTCLDCACGTGWHLFMLNKLGLQCFGSDLSRSMVTAAKKNLYATKVQLKQTDFRELSRSWKQTFDMIICMTTSFPHMLTDQNAITALESIYDRLNKGGILVIDNGISDSLLNEQPKFIPARILKNQAFYFFLEYPTPKKIIFHILHLKKTHNGFVHSYNVMPYNAMSKKVLEKMFSKSPFKKVKFFGNYNFSRYTKRSKRLIILAQKN